MISMVLLSLALGAEPPLHVAIQKGDTAKVKELLAAGASPNELCDAGLTALLEAVRWGTPLRAELVLALLDAGADPKPRVNARTVLSGALWALGDRYPGAADVIDALLAKGASTLEPVGDANYYRERPFGALRRAMKGRKDLPPDLDRVFAALSAAERKEEEDFERTLTAEAEADAMVWRGATDPRAISEAFADVDDELQRRTQTHVPELNLGLKPGFPKVVKSDAVSGMKPGFFVVVLGFCAPSASGAALEGLKRFGDAAIYTRRVKAPSSLLATCPSPSTITGDTPLVVKSKTQVLTATPFNDEDHQGVVVTLRGTAGEFIDLFAFTSGCTLDVSATKTSVTIVNQCNEEFVERELCTYPAMTERAVITAGPTGLQQRGTLGAPRKPSMCGE
ncbi:MAG: ankyrin repeat domain-containing protein [Myxococcaceae bacterium]